MTRSKPRQQVARLPPEKQGTILVASRADSRQIFGGHENHLRGNHFRIGLGGVR
jgi:hypothetical protein